MANHFRKPGSHRYHKSGVRPAPGPDLSRSGARAAVRRLVPRRDTHADGSRLARLPQLLNSPLPRLANTPTFEVVVHRQELRPGRRRRALPAHPDSRTTKTEPFPIPLTAPNGLAAVEHVWLAAALNLVALRPQTSHIMVPPATTTSRSTSATSPPSHFNDALAHTHRYSRRHR